MIQLTENISWDETKPYSEQSNECKNFIQNVIQTYDRTAKREAIPMSSLHRALSNTYTLDNGVQIKELFEYENPVDDAGWAAVKSYKIECYG